MSRPVAALVLIALALAVAAPVAVADVRFLDAWGAPGTGQGQFDAPAGVAADDDGHVFVADTGNDRIQRFDDGGHFELAFGAGTLNAPAGVAVGGGFVYVADSASNRIVKFTESGGFVTSWTDATALAGVTGVALDADGAVYATGPANRILKFTGTGAPLGQWGETGPLQGQFTHAQGIAATGPDIVYVADDANLVVQPWILGSGPLPRFGGAGVLTGPAGIASDPTSGDLLVTDRPAGVVERRTAAGAFVSSFGTSGSGNGQFAQPAAVAVDCRGTIFVADTGNNRVQKFGDGVRSARECFPPRARIAVNPAAPATREDVTFDGGGSTDADGQIVSWDWQVQGPERFEAEGARVTHVFTHTGTYDVRLRITDDEGNKSEATASMTVVAGPDPLIARTSTTALRVPRLLRAPFVRVRPSKLSVAAFRRGGVRIVIGRAPAGTRAFTVTIKRSGARGCTVLRRTVRPNAAGRRRLSTSSAGLATRVRAGRAAAARRCAARGGKFKVSVSLAGVRAAPATAGLELVRRQRR